jgi:carbonic anhydrase/acetyltransferase-like protein (isoleucine patch superfamily)
MLKHGGQSGVQHDELKGDLTMLPVLPRIRPMNIMPNPVTSFTPQQFVPAVMPGASVHPQASVIGNTVISSGVNVAPFASIRGDEGTPIFIGQGSNIQDGVIIHGLKDGRVDNNGAQYSVYIGENTSLAHQAQVHGPAKVGNNVFVGMQSFVFKSEIGDGSVIEPAARVIGVKVAPNKYIPAGEVVKTQEQADKLPDITADYANKHLNHEVVEVNQELAAGYPANYYFNM